MDGYGWVWMEGLGWRRNHQLVDLLCFLPQVELATLLPLAGLLG
jgi:hypothetical protein